MTWFVFTFGIIHELIRAICFNLVCENNWTPVEREMISSGECRRAPNANMSMVDWLISQARILEIIRFVIVSEYFFSRLPYDDERSIVCGNTHTRALQNSFVCFHISGSLASFIACFIFIAVCFVLLSKVLLLIYTWLVCVEWLSPLCTIVVVVTVTVSYYRLSPVEGISQSTFDSLSLSHSHRLSFSVWSCGIEQRTGIDLLQSVISIWSIHSIHFECQCGGRKNSIRSKSLRSNVDCCRT